MSQACIQDAHAPLVNHLTQGRRRVDEHFAHILRLHIDACFGIHLPIQSQACHAPRQARELNPKGRRRDLVLGEHRACPGEGGIDLEAWVQRPMGMELKAL